MSNPTSSQLSNLADAAFRQAADTVVLKARQTGTPVIVWEDGQIRYLSPDQAQERINTQDQRGSKTGT